MKSPWTFASFRDSDELTVRTCLGDQWLLIVSSSRRRLTTSWVDDIFGSGVVVGDEVVTGFEEQYMVH